MLRSLRGLGDVYKRQSTNDAYPTALHLALHDYLSDLAKAMEHLKKAYERKAEEFKDVLKMGRTQLQDAVPMTLGREFKTFAVMIGEDIQLSLIHISEPTRLLSISYAVFCLKKKKK
ncbi:lyase family protein, partial [Campylobacter coli]|uniref:lyase family protein n=1 Tax=Campylobacter coli TaxID=195 RepID=UPI000B0FF165